MLRLKFTFLLCLLFGVVHAQPYLATRATIYDQGPDPYFPPADVAEPDGYRLEIWRFVPGSRFESGWDLKIEERKYDPNNRLVSWTRYQTVSGAVAWQKEIDWDQNGNRTKEKVVYAAEAPAIPYTYENKLRSTGRLESAKLKAADGSLFASLSTESDGKLTYIESPDDPTNSRTYVYDAKGRSLSFVDAKAGRKINYEYDFQGNMTKMVNQLQQRKSVTEYKNEYDSNGRLVRQTEKNGSRSMSRTFHYNDKDQVIMRSDASGKPVEYRDYFHDGRLAAILITGPDGHPMEIIRFAYLKN